MKSREASKEVEAVLNEGGCCSTSTTSVKDDPCCDQPTDGSSCCDKSEAKEVNAEKTGCC